jgi:hypothetical protein
VEGGLYDVFSLWVSSMYFLMYICIRMYEYGLLCCIVGMFVF